MRGPFVTTTTQAAAKSRKRCRPRTPLSFELRGRQIMAEHYGLEKETAFHVQGSCISNMDRTSARWNDRSMDAGMQRNPELLPLILASEHSRSTAYVRSVDCDQGCRLH